MGEAYCTCLTCDLDGEGEKFKGINTGEVPLLEDFRIVYTLTHTHLCAHVCTLTHLINTNARSLAHMLQLLPQAHIRIFAYSTVHGKVNYPENLRLTAITYSFVHLFSNVNICMFVMNSASYLSVNSQC